ncbi:hypothetical protein HYV71_00850 [Candidatus Uhrbacteria bacterium]|nr:hypothetical protein [Candidatus Uhrbacteria bacterium]
MRDRFTPKEIPITERLAKWPGMQDRIKEVFRLNETGGEPFFFLIETETGDRTSSPLFQGEQHRIEAPLAVMFNYLCPQFTEEDFDRIANGEGTQEEVHAIDAQLAKVKGKIHFHPNGVVEPSMDDLSLMQHLYSLYSSAHFSPPLQIIGRKNQENKFDLLSFNQIADLPAPEIVTQLPKLVEKYVLLRALPGYLRRIGQSGRATELRQSLFGLENLQFDQFITRYKEIIASMPGQEFVESFRTQFRGNFTVFPEYLSCVQAALSEFKCFETHITSIDPEN